MADSPSSFSIFSLAFQLGNCASTATANLLIALLILWRKELRKEKELILLGYYCFTDALYAYGAFYLALRRLDETLWPLDYSLVSSRSCVLHPLHLLIVFTYPAVPLAELALTIDRGIAIFRPAQYFRMDYRASIRSIIAITVIGLLFVGCCIYHALTRTEVYVRYGCYPEVYSSLFNGLMFGGKAILYTICCLVYVPIMIQLMYLHGTHKNCQCSHCVMKRSCCNIGLLIVGLLVLIIIPTPCLLLIQHSNTMELLFYNLALSKPWLNVIFALFSFAQIRRIVSPFFKSLLGPFTNGKSSRVSSSEPHAREYASPETKEST